MKILLAVSGGIDSMYMLNRAPELFPGALCYVAHCNFGLRGAESDGDQAFVEQWCREHGTGIFTKRFETAAIASERGISIEMAARDLRYEWFAGLCREHSLDAVAVAHNANDNAETLVLNLLRGTGSRGLRGISASREIAGIRVLRPLLGTSRTQILDWMQANGLRWREDSTNASSEYKRNLVRNEVFPLFAKLNPSFLRTLGEDMARFAQVDDIADDYYRAAREQVLVGDRIVIRNLRALRHWEYVLFRLLEGSGIGSDQFADLVRALHSSTPLAGKSFGPVITSSDSIIIANDIVAPQIQIEELTASELDSKVQKPGTIALDAEALPHGLAIRPWKEGDWMRPLGMRGRKKISDMFVDLKWTAADKKNARVIEMEGSHVAALLCERIDDAVRITDSSSRIYRISLSKSTE